MANNQGVSRLSENDINEVFQLFDTDQSGKLSNEELLFALKSLGVSGASSLSLGDASDMIRQVKYQLDNCAEEVSKYNGDFLTREEFVALVNTNVPKGGSPAEVEAAFKLFDRKKKGTLNVDDIIQVYMKVHEIHNVEDLKPAEKKMCADLFAVADRRGRGIQLEDWKYVVSQSIV